MVGDMCITESTNKSNYTVMKLIYRISIILSLALMATVSRAQSLAGIQDMATGQATPLDLVADEISTQDLAADQASADDASANEADIFEPSYSGFDFFASEEPLEMTLSFDIRGFVKSKQKPEYFDAVLTVKESGTDSITQDIKVKARGYFRCNFCSFPPIMMKFKNKNSDDIQVAGKTLKLVTHCHPTPAFDQYVLKEYLAYKLYSNLEADYSFRTRLVRIHYVDVYRPKNSYTAYGIVIENETMLATRNNAVVIKSDKFTPNDMNSTDMNRVALFNFMIGNTDWSVQMQHNIKILMSFDEPTGKGIPVLYDFDYSGLVDTYYSLPFEELPIKKVTERYYQGICTGNEQMKPLIDEFAALKDRMLGTIQDFPYLSKTDKKQAEAYISSFYSMYRNQNYMISQLNSTCRTF
jgi:hypothetical protein